MSAACAAWLATALAALPLAADAAGMNTHTMVGYRAAKYYGRVHLSGNSSQYNAAIAAHPDTVLAGADFPDFLYACGNYPDHHDAGEAAHWPPWQAAAIRYIRRRPDFASGNWTEATSQLVSFVFGVSVHYLTDEFWEGLNDQLGNGQGFVRELSAFNLDHPGTSDNDESPANMATDFDVSWAMDESGVKPWARYYPVDDIVNIYHEAGFPNVTKASISNCRALFDLGLWAEKAFGGVLFLVYSEYFKQVPLVAERVLDAPIGGIDDMAVWATFVWERVARWFDEGPPANPGPRAAADGNDEDDRWSNRLFQSMRPFVGVADRLQALPDPQNLFEISNPLDIKGAGLRYRGPLSLLGDLAHMLQTLIDVAIGEDSGFSVSQLLAAAKANADDVTSVATGSAAASPASTRAGEAPVEYFGSAVATGDFDGDGKPDAAVGAYGSGEPGSPQVGRVDVSYGSGGGARINGSERTHARFGWALAVLDLNLDGFDDLVVGAPEAGWNGTLPVTDATPAVRLWGATAVFFGSADGLPPTPQLVLRSHVDLMGLGYIVESGDVDGDGHPDLILGCPLYSTGGSDGIHTGRVYVVSASKQHVPGDVDVDAPPGASAASYRTLPAGTPYSWFGQALAAVPRPGGAPVLLVGSPGFRNAQNQTVGRVRAFTMAADGNFSEVFSVEGSEHLGEFGMTVAAPQRGPLFAVGSPAESRGVTRARVGAVRLFNSSALQLGQDASAAVATVAGTAAFGRFGSSVAFQGQRMVVGAPLTNGPILLKRELGAVYAWVDASTVASSADDTSADWSTKGSRQRGRLGSAFAVLAGSNASAPVQLWVGSPRADGDAGEMAGAVDVFTL